MSDVVVITGATKGVGRAVAERFARDGARIALLARGREGLDGTVKAVERLGGAGAAAADGRGRPGRGRRGRVGDGGGLRPDRYLDQRRDDDGVRLLLGRAPRRVPARDRGHLSRRRLGHALRAQPDAAARPRHDRPGRLGAGLPRDPAPGAVLRREARDEGVLRVGADGAHARGLERPRDDGAAAGPEHAPVRPLPLEDAEEAACRSPPIYQPEVAAEAIHYAAYAKRREVWCGGSTVYTILGERIAPWLGDRYLAKTGVSGQQTNEPVDAPREGNLFEPVDEGDPGAHGDFDSKAHSRSLQALATRHRATVLGSAAALALLARRAHEDR